jgi:hypothetical protein
MSSEYPAADVALLSFHDSELHGIRWEESGEDLTLLLTWYPPRNSAVACPIEATKSRLCAKYVTDLVVRVEYDGFMGTPPIYAVTVTALPANRWKVAVEFLGGPEGAISFECNDLSLKLSWAG